MIVHKNYYHDVRVRRYVESLAETGASVDVICLAPHDLDEAPEVQDRIRVYTIPVRHSEKSRMRYAFEYLFSCLLYFIRLSILHLQNHYQVVHVHNMPDFLILAALLPKMMGARLVLDIHDPMPEVFLSKYGDRPNKLLLRLIQLQEKLSCWLANEVITVNSTCQTNLINRCIPAEKITIVHNYPNPAIFDRKLYPKENGSPRKDFTLIYPGTLAPRYGLETVVRALPRLKANIPEIRLVIICQNTPYKDELRQLADQLGVLSSIEIKPPMRNYEIPYQLLQADVGLYPAVNDVHMNIATPTKVLEFSAMRLPILSSRLKMVEEIFSDSAIMFFEPQNVLEFTQCVLDLYRKPALRERLAANAYQIFLQKFSWDQEFRCYLEMLHRLLTGTSELPNLHPERD
jgi:glycosyltransferase involved in cell wall biosynthesis